MRVFLTGATGFLGFHLVRELLQHGHTVVAPVRNSEKAKKILGEPVGLELVPGDLEQPEAMIPHLAGCDAAVLAGAFFTEYYGKGGGWDHFQRVNVDGAITLLRAAKRAGLKKAVFLSSTGALAGADDQLWDPAPMTDLYRKSKVVGELAIAKDPELAGFPIITVRPGWIFGPEDPTPTSTTAMVTTLLNTKKLQMVQGSPGPVVDVRDVALAIRLALEKVDETRSYNLVGHSLGAADIYQRIAMQIPGTSVMAAPLWVAEILSRVLEIQSKITGNPNPLPIDGVRFVAKGHHVNNQRTRDELGMEFRPWEETERDLLASVRSTK